MIFPGRTPVMHIDYTHLTNFGDQSLSKKTFIFCIFRSIVTILSTSTPKNDRPAFYKESELSSA